MTCALIMFAMDGNGLAMDPECNIIGNLQVLEAGQRFSMCSILNLKGKKGTLATNILKCNDPQYGLGCRLLYLFGATVGKPHATPRRPQPFSPFIFASNISLILRTIP
jgi:hypothetical protein